MADDMTGESGKAVRSGFGGKIAAGLHFVATPIGSARDITLRALDVLAGADVIAAEDTRTARKLMEIHGIPVAGRPMIAYHDHNGAEARPKVLAALGQEKSVAYVSEAGTPLVADPGYQLGRAAIDAGYRVFAAPGPSAAVAALTVSGLASDRFLFAGFPPSQTGARRRWLEGLEAAQATLILYESPKRVHRILGELRELYGADRQVALCRELTKRFEEILRGSIDQVIAAIEGRVLKGEIVLVIDRAPPKSASAEDVDQALRAALVDLPVKAAAAQVASDLGVPRRDAYQAALRLKEEQG
ncbi:16S rRNA (cytidine(1402)-2'-O)-methyltransferase [Gymnodinialimonas sp. 2305UL16-5]|uniref:16S rRNA (cytidine(1402)-2'-O)-methyltransferase n=1 Tax=Gymnodinialimonas mytili TaxID=3126503 RepID=UPI0030A44693